MGWRDDATAFLDDDQVATGSDWRDEAERLLNQAVGPTKPKETPAIGAAFAPLFQRPKKPPAPTARPRTWRDDVAEFLAQQELAPLGPEVDVVANAPRVNLGPATGGFTPLERSVIGKSPPIQMQRAPGANVTPDVRRPIDEYAGALNRYVDAQVEAPPDPTQTVTRGRFTGLPGRDVTSESPEYLTEGVLQAGKGLAGIARSMPFQPPIEATGGRPVAPTTQGPDLRASVSDTIEGLLTATTPLMVAGGISAPMKAGIAYGLTLVAQRGAAGATKALGGDAEAQRLVGNLVALGGLAGGVKAVLAGADVAAAKTAEAGRAGILALKLQTPNLQRAGFGRAGVHTPFEVIDTGTPSTVQVPPGSGPAETLTEAVRTALAPEPPPLQTDVGAEPARPAVPVTPRAPVPTETSGVPPAGPAAAAAEPTKPPEPHVARVPFMVTRQMEAELRARGYDQATIDRLTPADAHRILATQATPAAEAPKPPAAAEPTKPPEQLIAEIKQDLEDMHAAPTGQQPPSGVEQHPRTDGDREISTEASGRNRAVGVAANQPPTPEAVRPAAPEGEGVAASAASPPTAKLALPNGWTATVGRTRTKEGQTAEGEVDWRGKRLVFSEQQHFDNPEIWNHEVAHVVIETLPQPQQEALFNAYIDAKKQTPEWKQYGADWIVKNKFHREEIAMDAGEYVTDPSRVAPEVRAVFDEHLAPHLRAVQPTADAGTGPALRPDFATNQEAPPAKPAAPVTPKAAAPQGGPTSNPHVSTYPVGTELPIVWKGKPYTARLNNRVNRTEDWRIGDRSGRGEGYIFSEGFRWVTEHAAPAQKPSALPKARSAQVPPFEVPAGDARAYRGYLVRRGRGDDYSVSKDGTHIYGPASLEQARAAVDAILGETGREEGPTGAPAGHLEGRGAEERAGAPSGGTQPQGERPPRRPTRQEREHARDTEGLDRLVADAKAAGFAGDEPALRRELADRLQLVKDLDAEFAESGHNPLELLREIARGGGISVVKETGQKGEIRWLKDFQDRRASQAKRARGNLAKQPVASGQMRGVRGVFRNDGLTLDGMLEYLRQFPQFSHIRTLTDLVQEIRVAATAEDPQTGIDRLVESLGPEWWKSIGTATPHAEDATVELAEGDGDTSFNPEELEREQTTDTLDTGEQQPRLPEAGAARQVGKAETTFRAPQQASGGDFSLEAPNEAEARAREEQRQNPSMFGKDKGSPSGGGREGSAGGYNPNLRPPGAGSPRQPVAIQFPELVDLARELVATPRVVKAFRKEGKVGEFQSDTGTIRLAADLFKPGNEQQLAATLAHEIGHLTDWLPQKTLKRGNLLGRLYSLQNFLKGRFSGPNGVIENKTIRGELQALSDKWRPWDPATASASFKQYRHSGKELYADAISVLLNNPELLRHDAPTFYGEFFDALDRKPEVKRAYFDLQALLARTPEDLIAHRRAGVQQMFNEGDTKARDLEALRERERALSASDLWLRTRIQLYDKNTPLIDRVKALKKRGVTVNPDDDPRYALEERNYLGGLLKAFTEEHFQPVYENLTKAGVDWHTFGEALFYDRIAEGDRSELANPRGLSPETVADLRAALRKSLTPDQRKVLDQSITAFRTAVRQVAEDAYKAGLYTDALHQEMLDNPAYATYRVIEYLEDAVTSRVYKQIGTLKDIQNVADATMLKTLATIRAVEQQKMKMTVFDFLHQHFPETIEQAREVWGGKGRRPIEPKDREKQRLVTYYERGRLRGKYVDPYVADSLTNASVGQNSAVVQTLRVVNTRWLRPVFTTMNLGFQTANGVRDFLRWWKNDPNLSFATAMKRYKQAVPLAFVRAFGLPEKPSLRARFAQGHADLLAAEHAKILSVTYNDFIAGRTDYDLQVEQTLAKMGIGGYGIDKPTPALIRPLKQVLTFIEELGNFVESLPKAAAIYEYRGTGGISDIPPDVRSFIRRKVGSPDFLAGGTWTPVTNNLVLFSNAIAHAIGADIEVATGPTTRAGFWWKTAKLNILPKLIAFAVLTGLAGYAARKKKEEPDAADKDDWLIDLHRLYSGMTEYDLTNYTTLPLGFDTDAKGAYARIPQDDSGKLVGGLVWKTLRANAGDRELRQGAGQVLDYIAGQAPGWNPILNTASDITAFASGRNIYDTYRNRFLFTEDELKAQDRRTLKKFLGWEFQQLGGGIVWKFFAGEPRPREQTTAQKILEFPIVSNVLGRWIRITDYGQTEKLRATVANVQQQEARARLDERDAVYEAIKSWQRLAPPARTPEKQQELANGIVDALYTKLDKDEQDTKYRAVLKKLQMGIVRGEADPLTDTVLSATSNAQKVAAILKASEDMTPREFETWMQRAADYSVISENVANAVDAARTEKKTGTR